MRLRVFVGIVLAVAVGACAARPGMTDGAIRQEVKADKWFVVIVDKNGEGDCTVSVTPDTGPLVKVKAGWTVAWLLVNRCDDEEGITLDFEHRPETGKPARINPIRGLHYQHGVLVGKVIKRPWYSSRPCREFVLAPCGRYKYDVTVGTKPKLDPDIEIIMY